MSPTGQSAVGHLRQCTATSNTTGKRCEVYAMKGQAVCRMHGGSSPQARAAAKRRLEAEAAAKSIKKIWNPDADPTTHPVLEMQRLSGRLREAVEVLGEVLNESRRDCDCCGATALDNSALYAWRSVAADSRALLTDMAKLNIAERALQLQQDAAYLLGQCVLATFESLDLSSAQQILGRRFLLHKMVEVGILEPSRTDE